VIVLPQTATGRIVLAVILSLSAHTILLFSPVIALPPGEVLLPPLVARLEPLPKEVPRAAAIPQPKPKPKPRPIPAVSHPLAPKNLPGAETTAVEKLVPDTEPKAENPSVAPTEVAQPAHPLPQHAQLTFIVFKGTDFAIGESRHRLEIKEDKRYTLTTGMNTTGIASVFKTFELSQQSSGILTAQGLQPSLYSETKNTSKGKQALEAKFDWQERNLVFSSGNTVPLPEQAQDIISFMYQLSQLPLGQGTIALYISNGKKLERYELAVGEEEEIQTRLGKLRAIPLRKVHNAGEEGLDIWLGVEYRLLPIKIRQIDRNGEIAGEMVVADIRVANAAAP
jgi:hypothetical protein